MCTYVSDYVVRTHRCRDRIVILWSFTKLHEGNDTSFFESAITFALATMKNERIKWNCFFLGLPIVYIEKNRAVLWDAAEKGDIRTLTNYQSYSDEFRETVVRFPPSDFHLLFCRKFKNLPSTPSVVNDKTFIIYDRKSKTFLTQPLFPITSNSNIIFYEAEWISTIYLLIFQSLLNFLQIFNNIPILMDLNCLITYRSKEFVGNCEWVWRILKLNWYLYCWFTIFNDSLSLN